MSTGAARRQQHGRERVVRDAVRGLREQVRRRRRDDHRMGALGDRHVLHRGIALRIEEIVQHGAARQRPERERPDEMLRVSRQAGGHPRAGRRQLAEEEHRLEGGDGARDTEEDLPPVEAAR
jgi:hypothetical protein